ncbi:MAG: hypothetical protein J6W80_05845 [Kiritimatiellae bacterium]|nr:hypothetical protein [Kiritimatiellia bacterium]
MKKFLEILVLESKRLVRTGTAGMLASAAVAWMFAMPYLVRSDGTASGATEMYMKYSLGGVFALVTVALAASAAGSISAERDEKRLQLTLARPVRFFVVALGRMAAISLCGAAVLALATAILVAKIDSRPCSRVYSPKMESPREEALRLYDSVMQDPGIDAEIKKAPKDAILRVLEQKAWDNYQTIPKGRDAAWKMGDVDAKGRLMSVRLRFTNNFDTREKVVGVFRYGGFSGSISNVTQAVVAVPLDSQEVLPEGDPSVLTFSNRGENTLMLRPRRDIKLLVEADSFAMNAVRAWIVLSSMLALVVAFAVFLGSALGKAVAIFTVMSFLAVTEMGPSVVEQYPDALETDTRDRISLMVTRAVGKVTRPVGSFTPLESLAANDMVEFGEVARAVGEDMVVLPLLLAFLSGLALSFKKV